MHLKKSSLWYTKETKILETIHDKEQSIYKNTLNKSVNIQTAENDSNKCGKQ